MNDRRLIAFLAHVIIVGKANLADDEKTLVQQLATHWLRPTDRVRKRPDATPTSGFIPDFSGGQITDVSDDGMWATVKLDTSIDVQDSSTGLTARTDTIVIPQDWLERDDVPPTPAPAQ